MINTVNMKSKNQRIMEGGGARVLAPDKVVERWVGVNPWWEGGEVDSPHMKQCVCLQTLKQQSRELQQGLWGQPHFWINPGSRGCSFQDISRSFYLKALHGRISVGWRSLNSRIVLWFSMCTWARFLDCPLFLLVLLLSPMWRYFSEHLSCPRH